MMYWTAGLVLLALAFSQVPAAKLRQGLEPMYLKTAIAKAGSTASERIVSGWEAEPGQHPHQASLRLVNPDGGVSSCGGSVVHRSWVISAAHCTAGRVTLVVRAGVVHIATPEYIFETREWWNYPTFDESRPDLVQPNDISVIKLQIPVVYTDMLKAIRVQSTTDAFKNYANELVVASGWGRLWTNGILPETLNWVYLTAISNFDCGWTYGFNLITDNTICARYYNVTSQSTCQGDSGGPLVHTGADGIPTLVGIASFVAGGDFGCHSEHPAGFIRPGPFISWLNEITGLDFDNLNEEEENTTTTQSPITTTSETPTTTESPTTTTSQATTTTQAPTTTTSQEPTTTESPTTTTSQATTTTQAPTTTTSQEPTTTESPTTTTSQATTTTQALTTTTTQPSSTTTLAPAPEPEDSGESEESSEEDADTPDLLNKLVVKVKVKVKVNNKTKRRIKLKCVDKF